MADEISSGFSGDTRATYGIIATFDRDGERFSRHFSQLIEEGETVRIKSRQKRWKRTRTRMGTTSVQQVIDFCDKHGCKVVCLSTPETILRDMQGSRISLRANSNQRRIRTDTTRPEWSMLRARQDLLLEPSNTWNASHGPERN